MKNGSFDYVIGYLESEKLTDFLEQSYILKQIQALLLRILHNWSVILKMKEIWIFGIL